jgi:hypothetical protein
MNNPIDVKDSNHEAIKILFDKVNGESPHVTPHQALYDIISDAEYHLEDIPVHVMKGTSLTHIGSFPSGVSDESIHLTKIEIIRDLEYWQIVDVALVPKKNGFEGLFEIDLSDDAYYLMVSQKMKPFAQRKIRDVRHEKCFESGYKRALKEVSDFVKLTEGHTKLCKLHEVQHLKLDDERNPTAGKIYRAVQDMDLIHKRVTSQGYNILWEKFENSTNDKNGKEA